MNSSYLRPFARFQAALAWARCRAASSFSSSRLLRSALFSRTTKYVQIAPAVITTPAMSHARWITDSKDDPLWLMVLLLLVTVIAANAIFHLLLVPFLDWLVERLS